MVNTLLDQEFLNQIVYKYLIGGLVIHITDEEALILASTDSSRQGTKSKTAQHILFNNNGSVVLTEGTFGGPIYYNKELCGSVVVHGPSNIVTRQGELIMVSIESALEFASYSQNWENEEIRMAKIARLLLEEKPEKEKLLSLMHKQEIDIGYMRSVICISLKFHNHSGPEHQPDRDLIRNDVMKRLKENQNLNSQDIVYQYNENTIVVLKSFIPNSDPARVFPMLDLICADLKKMLEEFTPFSFGIAYGNLINSTESLKKSLDEALDIIKLGQQCKPNEKCFVLEYVLFDKVYQHLDPQIVSKIMDPALVKLYKKDGSLQEELINCAEAFVDNCMSFSETARNHETHRNTINTRLEKLKTLTGLDPARCFKDAFVVKMLAIHLKQSNGKA